MWTNYIMALRVIYLCFILFAYVLRRLSTEMFSNTHIHDDAIKWEHFPFVWGIHRSPENSPPKGQWRVALIVSMICSWINRWVNHREAGDLRFHGAQYDVIVMTPKLPIITPITNRPSFIRWINMNIIWIFRRDIGGLKLHHCYTKHSISSTYDCLGISFFFLPEVTIAVPDGSIFPNRPQSIQTWMQIPWHEMHLSCKQVLWHCTRAIALSIHRK